ncbi:MAG: hypothetical protein NT018_05935 [Armatimonadetes bacterium]|nr:hypothetical protein [Armatimonadota bacterium]
MDFAITGESSAYLIVPQSEKAKVWADEHVECGTVLGDGFGVESRYIEGLVAGILNARLEVTLNGDPLYIGDDGSVCVRRGSETNGYENLAPGIRSFLESRVEPRDQTEGNEPG